MPSAAAKLIAFSVTAFLLISAAEAFGQTPGFPWEGEVSGSNVYVRSGAGANWYPTMKLNAGDRILVLGDKFGWYQITPPQSSFSYIDMAMVERKPGDKIGTVKQDKVYVRAGSAIEQRKSATQVVLNKGATVEILGEAQGFFKIAPPPGATVYISKQYVKPIEAKLTTGMVERYLSNSPQPAPAEPIADASSAKTETPDSAKAADAKLDALEPSPTGDQVAQGASPDSVTIPPPLDDAAAAKDPSLAQDSNSNASSATPDASGATKPASADGTKAPAGAKPPVSKLAVDTKKPVLEPVPSKQTAAPAGKVEPGSARYEAMLAMCESELVSLLSRPLEEQDTTSLVKRYEEIASQKSEYIPAEVAKIRVRQLKNRMSLRDEHVALKPMENDLAQYRAGMDAERMRIMRKRTEAILETYDLEGELRRSLAFGPENRRFRLVDPATDSTVAYVDIPRSVDENPEHLIGRFVGIRTAGRTFSPSARVPIAVAGKVVDLTQRKSLMESGAQRESAPPPSGASPEASTGDDAQAPVNPRKTASSDDIGE
jgi:hypothetical protein